MSWRYLWRTPGQKWVMVQGVSSLPSPSSLPSCPSQAGTSHNEAGDSRAPEMGSSALRDPYKGILDSDPRGRDGVLTTCLRKAVRLLPHWSPSLLTEGAPDSPSLVRYAALDTLHSGSALPALAHLHLPLADSILLLIQPPIPFALCAAVGLLSLILQPLPLPHPSAPQIVPIFCYHLLMLFPIRWPRQGPS